MSCISSYKPHTLLVNPYILDFAAYDFWAKPLGLLTLGSILESCDFKISFIDCLDNHEFSKKNLDTNKFGKGTYLKTKVKPPEILKDVKRNFSRYGILLEIFKKKLLDICKPDIILVTSFMTYWYLGVFEVINILKEIFPKVPIILGGIYATLCYEHAVKYSNADLVIAGNDIKKIIQKIQEVISYKSGFNLDNLDNLVCLDNLNKHPLFNLQNQVSYVSILTSIGCPYTCSYCASSFLNPKKILRNPLKVADEIIYWHKKHGICDFVFYDDALLINPEKHANIIFEEIIKSQIKIRFHTPNAVHVNQISRELANLMFKAGFETLRLGLETILFNDKDRFDKKVNESDFYKALSNLKKSGFTKEQVGAYLLIGLPYQDLDLQTVEKSIITVANLGILPVLAYYSPIPHTQLWQEACKISRYNLESDPLFTNNSIFPCWNNFSWKDLSRLKNLCKI